jgi:hypothetical protein
MKKVLLIAAGLVAVVAVVALLSENRDRDLWDEVLDEF